MPPLERLRTAPAAMTFSIRSSNERSSLTVMQSLVNDIKGDGGFRDYRQQS